MARLKFCHETDGTDSAARSDGGFVNATEKSNFDDITDGILIIDHSWKSALYLYSILYDETQIKINLCLLSECPSTECGEMITGKKNGWHPFVIHCTYNADMKIKIWKHSLIMVSA